MKVLIAALADSNNVSHSIINYEIVRGNEVWRFALVLLFVLGTLLAAHIVQYAMNAYVLRIAAKKGEGLLTLLLKVLAKPAYVAIFAAGVYVCRLPLYFDNAKGIQTGISEGWIALARVIGAVAIAYALYRLVDVAEFYLHRLVARTESRLDDMLVPVVRKALRITIAIIAVLLISENVLGQGKIQSLLLGAGVGGIAVALAAKETVANFFGSVTIFADRPFQMGELVKIGEHTGSVEEVGFRSTRLRTLDGHLVTIPNSTVAGATIDNIAKRPWICRTSNIAITYSSGHAKSERAVQLIKEILAGVPEVNGDPDLPPRVYFSDFGDWSLNISMTYWVKPSDYWLFQAVNERVNVEIMKRFETEQIEFAFPSQTLYMKKD